MVVVPTMKHCHPHDWIAYICARIHIQHSTEEITGLFQVPVDAGLLNISLISMILKEATATQQLSLGFIVANQQC